MNVRREKYDKREMKLRRSRQKVVGVVVEHGRAYGRGICEGIAAFAQEHGGWELLALDLADVRKPHVVDGYIARVTDRDIAAVLRKTGRPVVDVYGAFPCGAFARVDSDHDMVGRLAAHHFMEHRFKNYAFYGFEGVPFSDARRKAFVDCLKRNCFPCAVCPTSKDVRTTFNFSTFFRNERFTLRADSRRVGAWLKHLAKPVAVFCSHDLCAYQLAQICRASGIDVPREAAILGVDDDTLLCAFSATMLSSVDPNAFGIGRAAAEALGRMLDGCPAAGIDIKVEPKGIVVRPSTEVYPFQPFWLSDALVFIRRNVAKGLTATDVYQFLNLSHTPVDRAFRDVLHSSVQREIVRVRFEEACRLLGNTTLSVKEIAARTGFSRLEYFCNRFKDKLGVSPLEWRAGTNGRG